MHFSFFPSFFDRPDKIKYAQQDDDENIELFLRRHWVTNIPWIVISIISILVPTLLIQVDQLLKINLLINIPPQILLGAVIVWYMLILTYVLENFLFWYFNIYIVTNKHLIDVNFSSLLYRDITEIELNDIEAISARIKGIFGPLFNYGDVIVETAAETKNIEFINIPKPDFVVDRIQDLQGVKNGH